MQAQQQYQSEELMSSLNATYFGNPFDEHNVGLVFAALHGDF
jgi:hypothetical protein